MALVPQVKFHPSVSAYADVGGYDGESDNRYEARDLRQAPPPQPPQPQSQAPYAPPAAQYASSQQSRVAAAADRMSSSEAGSAVPVGLTERERRAMDQAKKRQYAAELQQQMPAPPPPRHVPASLGDDVSTVPVGLTDRERRALDQEKKRQYAAELQQQMPQAPPPRHVPQSLGDGISAVPVGLSDRERRVLEQEKQRAYAAELRQQQQLSDPFGGPLRQQPRADAHYRDATHDEITTVPLGLSEVDKRRQDAEKKRAYAAALNQQQLDANPAHDLQMQPRAPYCLISIFVLFFSFLARITL